MCASLFLTVFDFDLSQLSDQWMPAICQCHHPWPFGMDDNETSAPSKSTTFATPETKQTKDHVSDEKVTASSETKEGVASTGEMRRERRTSSYLARRRFVAEEPLNFRRSGYAQQQRSTGRSYASQRGREHPTSPHTGDVPTSGGQLAGSDVPTLSTDRRRIRSVFKTQDTGDISRNHQVTLDGRLQETH